MERGASSNDEYGVMDYFVEVCVRADDATIIKREAVKSWNEALVTAQMMAVQMFYEDPMTGRLFMNGVYAYSNTNDMGYPVVIRPIVLVDGEEVTCPRQESCESISRRDGEAA